MINFFTCCAGICILVLALLIFACLIRAILGPRIPDRVMACNMIGTMTIAIIAILGTVMDQSWLYDICLLYAMISFLAVVVLARIYTGVYRMKKRSGDKENGGTDHE